MLPFAEESQSMKTRLKSCDRWHAETPARLVSQKSGRDRQGNYRYRFCCAECARIKVAEKRHNRALNRPYGIIRLNWAPPQL